MSDNIFEDDDNGEQIINQPNVRDVQKNWLTDHHIVGSGKRYFSTVLAGFYAIGGKFAPRQYSLPDGISVFKQTREATDTSTRDGYFYSAYPLTRPLGGAEPLHLPVKFVSPPVVRDRDGNGRVVEPTLSPGLTLLAGPPGGGKTRAALAIAMKAVAEGRHVEWYDIGEPNVGTLDGNASTYSAVGQILLDACFDHIDSETGAVMPISSKEWHSRPFVPVFDGDAVVAAPWQKIPLVVIDSVSMLSLLGTALARGGFAKSIFAAIRAFDQAARFARVAALATLNPLKVGERTTDDLIVDEAMAYSSMCQGVIYTSRGKMTYTQRPDREIRALTPLVLEDGRAPVLPQEVRKLSRDRITAYLTF